MLKNAGLDFESFKLEFCVTMFLWSVQLKYEGETMRIPNIHTISVKKKDTKLTGMTEVTQF